MVDLSNNDARTALQMKNMRDQSGLERSNWNLENPLIHSTAYQTKILFQMGWLNITGVKHWITIWNAWRLALLGCRFGFLGNIGSRLFQNVFQIDADSISNPKNCFKRRVTQFALHVADGLLRQSTLRGQAVFGYAALFTLRPKKLDNLRANCLLLNTGCHEQEIR